MTLKGGLQNTSLEEVLLFTAKYHCHKLVYYESFSDVEQAIGREKQLKGWKRERKEALIDSVNKERRDLLP